MKKIVVVFLITLAIVIAGLLAVSCNSAVKDELGTVVLDFGGSARALDSNALPILSTVRIKAEVTSSAGRTVQEYNPGREGNISLSLPVGERVVIKLSAYNASGIWSGSVTHTVEPGTNAVSVKLSKKIAGLNKLLFTQENKGSRDYNLTFYLGGKKVDLKASFVPYIFARDSLGRVYVGYDKGIPEILRYTSEGVEDKTKNLSLDFLANDYTAGKMYAHIPGRLVQIKDNLSESVVATGLTGRIFAVDNGRIAWVELPNRLKIAPIPTISPSPHSLVPLFAREIGNDIKIKDCLPSGVTDIFIRGGYTYVLFKTVNETITGNNKALCSLGGVVRYNINNLAEDPVKIGFDNDPDFENGVLEDYDYSENFYGAVKVIGFDDENLYIADDGFDAAYTDDYPRIVKNRNRIGVLNMKTNALSFIDAYPAKWNKEWSEWKGTKTIVWKKANEHAPLNYYQLENAGSPLPSTSLAPGMTDMFTYDQAGSLYIYKTVDKIQKFKLKDDGSYDTTSEDLPMGLSPNESMIGFAVDLSTKSLYYAVYNSGTPASYRVKKRTWTGNFGNAGTASEFLSIPASSGTVSALAANKDGVFAAVKTKSGNSVNDTYSIEVYKYSHDNASVAEKTIPIVSANPLYQAIQGTDPDNNNHKKYVDETVTALHIKNGVLYALTTERTVRRSIDTEGYKGPSFSYITGKLLQIGKDTSSFDEISAGRSVKQLYGYNLKDITPETSGDFAPVRFIAIKPKKLVIASTGYLYRKPPEGYAESSYKRKIYEFDLEAAAMPAGTAQDTTIFYKAFGECEYSW
ncbi:hypothetical protein V1L52_07930 [Treponema sp. HNW]|uniref:hypothetical protein n=1 Tax=Treponema sp. HNW TaxID=3116654 RepID=UPI003D11766C